MSKQLSASSSISSQKGWVFLGLGVAGAVAAFVAYRLSGRLQLKGRHQFQTAKNHIKNLRWYESEQPFTAALAAFEKDNDIAMLIECHYELGCFYYRTADMEKAITHLEKCLTLATTETPNAATVSNAKKGSILLLLGESYAATQRYQEAIEKLKEVEVLRDNSFSDWEERSLLKLAAVSALLDDKNVAKDYLQCALTTLKQKQVFNYESVVFKFMISWYQSKAASEKGVVQKLVDFIEWVWQSDKDDEELVMDCLLILATAYFALDGPQKSLDYWLKCKAKAEECQNPRVIAHCLGGLSNIYSVGNKSDDAMKAQQERLSLAEEHLVKALNAPQPALTLSTSLLITQTGMTAGQATYEKMRAILKLGNGYLQFGDLPRAIESHQQALDLSRELKDQESEAEALASLFDDWYYLGDEERTVYYAKELQAIADAVEGKVIQPLSHTAYIRNIYMERRGSLYLRHKRYEEAVGDFRRTLDFAQKTLLPNKNLLLNAMGNLASALSNSESEADVEEGLQLHEKHLQEALKTADLKAHLKAYKQMGKSLSVCYLYPQAIRCFQECLRILEVVRDPKEQAKILCNLANVLVRHGHTDEAEKDLKQALKVMESLRSLLGEREEYTRHFNRHLHDNYVTLQEILIDRGKVNEAFEIADQGHAQTLIETMCKRRNIATVNGLPMLKIDQLKEAAKKQDATIVEYTVVFGDHKSRPRRITLSGSLSTSLNASLGASSSIPLGESAANVGSLNMSMNLGESQVASSPLKYFLSTTSPKGDDVVGFIVYILDSRSGKVQYKKVNLRRGKDLDRRVGDDITDIHLDADELFAKARKRGKEVPYMTFQQVIQDLLKKMREASTAPVVVKDERAEALQTHRLGEQRSHDKTKVAKAAPPSLVNEHLHLLYKSLIQPIENFLPSQPDALVTIVPQYSLFEVPFAALLDTQGNPLITKHTISYSPSVTALHTIQATEQPPYPPETEALVVGDPHSAGKQANLRAMIEAQMVASKLRRRAIVGSEATKLLLLKNLSRCSVVHIASHGEVQVVEEEDPIAQQQSNVDEEEAPAKPKRTKLALSLAANKDAKPDEETRLFAQEILGLNLKAELVVLNAGDSSSGQQRFETIGQSFWKAFLAAGARSVVASLWPTGDHINHDLIRFFYENILDKKPALLPAHALRKAMLAAIEKDANPLTWAPFIFIGASEEYFSSFLTQASKQAPVARSDSRSSLTSSRELPAPERKARMLVRQIQAKTGFEEVGLARLEEVFKSKARHGALTRETFAACFNELFPFQQVDAVLPIMLDFTFKVFDRDGNGKVDWIEFVSGMALLCKGSKEEKMKFLFSMFDSDNDGTINEEEMLNVMNPLMLGSLQNMIEYTRAASKDAKNEVFNRVLGSVFEEDEDDGTTEDNFASLTGTLINDPRFLVRECFRTADVDHDGRISFEEWMKWANNNADMLAVFDLLDHLDPTATQAHYGISCAGCKQNPIIGVRYRCKTCLLFDLCQACHDAKVEVGLHSSSHQYEVIEHPSS